MSLLEVENLHTHFVSRDAYDRVRTAKALNGVSFRLDPGETLGLVGETGAGKSLTAQSVTGLLRPPARIVDGRVTFDGRDLRALSTDALNALRGNEIAMVVQNPRTSLDPLMRIGEQLVRLQRAHRRVSRADARERAIRVLGEVGIPAPEARYHAWPHELSGGMAQRVLIALALVNEPKLLIADEPTTGLDVTVQAQILDLVRDLASGRRMATLVITHDLGVVAHYCDRVAVMFAGAIVEQGPVKDVFGQPAHPYTRALLAAVPERGTTQLSSGFGGPPPDLFALPEGCLYRDRCAHAAAECASPPPDEAIGRGHVAACHFAARLATAETTA